jgi:membrane peptidoglycan carboxypeptidase
MSQLLRTRYRRISRRTRSFFTRYGGKNKKRIAFIALGWAALAGAAALSVLFFFVTRGLPSPDQIANPVITESTKIYDRSGEVVLYEISGGQRRTSIGFDEIPESLKDATLAIENNEFYSEPAFSIRGIVRSLIYNITNPGGPLRGGSTITQQLARNAFLSLDQTIIRKLKELIVAIQIDRQYTKDKILELYLNQVPYGPVIYGVEGASQAYFGKSAKDLTVSQSAILAAIPRAPSYYSPWGNHVGDLVARQRLVLQRMYDTDRITKEELGSALAEPVTFMPRSSHGLNAAHFVMEVQDYLVEKYGEDTVRTGGLRVVTTLDWELQQLGERVVAEGAARNERLYGGKNAALVAQDPRTGQILALVGSRNYFDPDIEGQFNVATNGLRQPGSALKPFVYMDAFMKGYTPNTTLFDLPTEFSGNSACPMVPSMGGPGSGDTRCFHPQNFDGDFAGPVSMRTALAHSINVPAVKTLYLTGLNSAVRLMHSMGLSTLDDPRRYGLALVLGGGAVHLTDLVNAYSVLSQDGVMHEQAMVLEVRDKSGNVLEQYQDQEKQIVDSQYPRLINNILSDVDARRGLFQSSLGLTVFPGYDVAMKTGTSNDYRDAWTMGYTPSLVVGVWAGNNDNAQMHQQGSSLLAAVPIWSNFMSEAITTRPPENFTDPAQPAENKPIFSGRYVQDGQAHTILYYVDRNDPAGPPPSNPANDPQFLRWESSVQSWASFNPFIIMSQSGIDGATSSDPFAPNEDSFFDDFDPFGSGPAQEAATSTP